jgi:hypothetical protein
MFRFVDVKIKTTISLAKDYSIRIREAEDSRVQDEKQAVSQ